MYKMCFRTRHVYDVFLVNSVYSNFVLICKMSLFVDNPCDPQKTSNTEGISMYLHDNTTVLIVLIRVHVIYLIMYGCRICIVC